MPYLLAVSRKVIKLKHFFFIFFLELIFTVCLIKNSTCLSRFIRTAFIFGRKQCYCIFVVVYIWVVKMTQQDPCWQVVSSKSKMCFDTLLSLLNQTIYMYKDTLTKNIPIVKVRYIEMMHLRCIRFFGTVFPIKNKWMNEWLSPTTFSS